MLQRIYGLCFASGDEPASYLQHLVEVKKRDHHILGKDLELFLFSEDAPGIPYWFPKGLKIYQELIAFWRHEHELSGYQEISSPLIHRQDMWEISGRWEHDQEEMYHINDPKEPGRYLGMKPMSCPDAMVVFNHQRRSYRELPLRLADCDSLHRNELSGALHGLLRVRRFSQDDAHIFVMQGQIMLEILGILELVDHFYSVFGPSYKFRLGICPEKHVREPVLWNKAEQVLKEILMQQVNTVQFEVVPGEGAFYGPKIDLLIQDCLSRNWQIGSIQLDFHLPARFGCYLINSEGKNEIPVVIHRVIYGSMEQFIGILLE